MGPLKVFAPLGGGIGDVWWDWLHDAAFQKIPSLVENYGAIVRIVTQCHCAGVEDLFRHSPYVHEVITEAWHPPTQEDMTRWNVVSDDGYIPIGQNRLLHEWGVREIAPKSPGLFTTDEERAGIVKILSQHPCIVAQPYAGLSDRDGFDPASLGKLAENIRHLDRTARLVVIGRNHERGHKYTLEVCPAHPNILNLIDCLDIRQAYTLVSLCDAFVGCHSNLIRCAWDHRRRTALVLPDPLMTRHMPTLDPKYTYGMGYPENRTFTFPFDNGQERQFDRLDTEGLARFLLRGG